jgi:hypothetical protein
VRAVVVDVVVAMDPAVGVVADVGDVPVFPGQLTVLKVVRGSVSQVTNAKMQCAFKDTGRSRAPIIPMDSSVPLCAAMKTDSCAVRSDGPNHGPVQRLL